MYRGREDECVIQPTNVGDFGGSEGNWECYALTDVDDFGGARGNEGVIQPTDFGGVRGNEGIIQPTNVGDFGGVRGNEGVIQVDSNPPTSVILRTYKFIFERWWNKSFISWIVKKKKICWLIFVFDEVENMFFKITFIIGFA